MCMACFFEPSIQFVDPAIFVHDEISETINTDYSVKSR